MLTALPIVLACHALQPCQPAPLAPQQLVRSASPAAIVTRAQPREALTADTGRAFQHAVQRFSTPSATARSRARSGQASAAQRGRTTYNKALLVFAGVLAGCYAGGYIGESMEENAGFVGMMVGAAAGGLIAWTLVR
jgi:hypothetical protein